MGITRRGKLTEHMHIAVRKEWAEKETVGTRRSNDPTEIYQRDVYCKPRVKLR